MRKILLLSVSCLWACAAIPASSDVEGWMETRHLSPPVEDSFPHCRGYGCRIVERLHFDGRDWLEIDAAFRSVPKTAEDERRAVKVAIGAFERRVGSQLGTTADVAGTFARIGDHQQDCIDESTNTTVFLTMLKRRGLLRFHEVKTPAGRFPVFAGGFWPHHAAVMSETKTGKLYVVDSWFENGGRPAHVVDLETWMRGWTP